MCNKLCLKCKIEKPITEFSKNKVNKDGFQKQCKTCDKEKNKKYREKNKEYFKEYLKEYNRQYLVINKEKIKKTKQNQYQNNKEEIKKKSKKYYDINKKTINEKKKKYLKKYRELNKDKISKYKSQYFKTKRTSDPLFKLKMNIRNSVSRYIRNKNNKTIDILGCSFEELKLHLESKFQPWMNWDNYGRYNGAEGYGWDIDHIIPLKTAKTENDVIKLNHFSNLQPLCSYINRVIKKNKK